MRDGRNCDWKTEVLCVDISDICGSSGKMETKMWMAGAWMERVSERLSMARRKKIESLQDEDARAQSMAAGLLLDYGLRERGYCERDIIIRTGAHGKPYFPEIPDLFFNLSHSGNRVMAVFSEMPAGCDIQIIKPGSSRIAGRFFMEEEAAYIWDSGPDCRDAVFTELWTMKESYLKATGEGMSRDLKSFCVLEGRRPAGTFFRSYQMGSYRAAICIEAGFIGEGRERILPDICFCPFQNLIDVV